MATVCLKTLQFCRVRVAKLNADGSPKQGAGNMYVTDQQVSLVIGLNLSAGDDFEQKTGCGDISFSFKDRDKVKNLTFTLILATAEPQLTQMLIGGDLLMSGPDTVGFALPAVGTTGNEDGSSVEGWTKNIKGSALDPDWPYVRWVFPKTFWTPASKTLANGPIVHEYTGEGQENENWLDGPANDWDYTSDRLLQYAADTDLPTAACEATAVPVS